MIDVKNSLWAEKYRPQNIGQLIIPDRIKKVIQGYLDKKDLPHFLFYSQSPGTSKTTTAKVIIKELDADSMFINGSGEDSSKGAFLEKVVPFASSVSLSDSTSPKIVLCDESERLATATQDAMKGHIEQFSSNCRFILTANSYNRIIEPIKSRCTCINFTPEKSEYPQLMQQIFKRCDEILKIEDIDFDKEILAKYINQNFPDFRRIINGLQSYSNSAKKIDANILKNIEVNNVSELLYGLMKKKNFTELRKFMTENIYSFQDYVDILFSGIDKNDLTKAQIPPIIVTLNEYAYKNAFVTNSKISILAMFVELIEILNQ